MAATNNNGRVNGVYSYDTFGGNKKENESHFLWWCAGAHQSLLKEYPSEHTRYAGLGGVLLATFVLASISAGYAIYSVFDNVGWAIAFGLIWGLIIFNFDRFLVSTMRKYGVSAHKQLWMAVPRILLALLIAITIARPLELKIFEKEIDVKVAENRHKKILLNDSLLNEESKTAVYNAGQERSRLMLRKLSIEDTLHQLQEDYLHEADGTGGSKQRGIERLTLLKQQAYNLALQQFSPELKQLGEKINYQDSILNNNKSLTEQKRKQYETELNAKVGFLERNKALSDLSSQEGSVFWANFFISFLIILIEISPVLSKLIMNVGPYDVALAKTELMQMAFSENEMRGDKELVFEKQKDLYKKKREATADMMDTLNALQKKHISNEIEKWERGERNTNDKIPLDEFIKKIKEQYNYNEENIL
ncbi:MAG: DUF4407 domain-containing protein [Bacteroidetes bacterium]|nr:DUF4407 domain-containing protein [Bacteroidota bacterium]